MTVLDAISKLGEINNGKSDKETHAIVKQIIKAMETKNASWPNAELTKVVYQMDEYSKALFLEVLKDMDVALDEHFGIIEV